MNTATVVISSAGQVIQLTGILMDLALKIQALLSKDPGIAVELKDIQDRAVAAADETLQSNAEWRAKNGV